MDNLLTIGLVIGGIYLYKTHMQTENPGGPSIGSGPGDELDPSRYKTKYNPHGNRSMPEEGLPPEWCDTNPACD